MGFRYHDDAQGVNLCFGCMHLYSYPGLRGTKGYMFNFSETENSLYDVGFN